MKSFQFSVATQAQKRRGLGSSDRYGFDPKIASRALSLGWYGPHKVPPILFTHRDPHAYHTAFIFNHSSSPATGPDSFTANRTITVATMIDFVVSLGAKKSSLHEETVDIVAGFVAKGDNGVRCLQAKSPGNVLHYEGTAFVFASYLPV